MSSCHFLLRRRLLMSMSRYGLSGSEEERFAGNKIARIHKNVFKSDNAGRLKGRASTSTKTRVQARELFAEGLLLRQAYHWVDILAWILTGDSRRVLTLVGVVKLVCNFLVGTSISPSELPALTIALASSSA
ncbi:hypothetical protein CBOM_08057 [Ceraceosorus bombacis]|uniref:Uncharacterized protein n=1 Tax=Ceraceosorus bombacis TaxID=401625 RepID=A0A0P1BL74_9BASI|nr:hypothetical protein CBOM_08057 [Ceraceosorus bombacis]